ncbi:IPT/TIG domain-containing protein [Actinoplanes sp. NPDC026670]|uniref:IPT/TIG domain-containing protein n=1 Tax=Actinoplanes sp. NPDC026670 TaxID=3154700 RepID=UPI0033EF9346
MGAGRVWPASGPVRPLAAVPVIDRLSPSAGSVDGGAVVTVLGSGFKSVNREDATAVKFGDLPADRFVVVSDTKLVAVAPPGVPGTVRITVANGDGVSVSRTATFSYRAPIGVEFESVTVSATGGAEILADVNGSSLGTASEFTALKVTARVGEVAAKVAYVNADRVKITVPATTELGPVTVRLLQGEFAGPASTATVTYVPGVTTITPARVSAEGGDTVRIVGGGFGTVDPDDPGAVTFGGTPAASFEVVSDTVIEATAPGGDGGPVAVVVKTPAASSPESATARVTYVDVLTVDTSGGAFIRASGGSHTLAIAGGTLGADAKSFAASGISLLLGTTKVTATWVDPTHLSILLPPQSGESATLTLKNGAVTGIATLPVIPVVTSLSVSSGSVTGGKLITVQVAGATAITDFRFGDTVAECSPVKSGYACVAPPAAEAGPVWVRFTTDTGVASGFTAAATFSYTDLD